MYGAKDMRTMRIEEELNCFRFKMMQQIVNCYSKLFIYFYER